MMTQNTVQAIRTASTIGCYNNDVNLWRNYGQTLRATMPYGGARIRVHAGGLSNGHELLAVFPDQQSARQCLIDAGWREIEADVFKAR